MAATPVPHVLETQRTCPYAPPQQHTRLQREEPITRVLMPSGSEVWAVSRLADIRTMLTDPRFSSDRRNPGFPLLFKDQRPVTKDFRPTIITMDPPEHGPARKAVLGEFTVKRMNALRPRIQEIVDEHIGALLAGPRPADLVQALSLPVPSMVICE